MNNKIYEKAKKRFLNGDSMIKISKDMGINRKKLSFKLRQDGIKTSKNTLNKDYTTIDKNNPNKKYDYDGELAKKILKEYTKHKKTAVEIAEEHPPSASTVRRILRYHSVDTSYDVKRYRKYKLNEKKFENIDNEHKSYWLGFLYADGYIKYDTHHIIELVLQWRDKNHIEKFKNFLEFSGNIKKKNVKLNNNNYKAAKLSICSKKLVMDSYRKGLINNKSEYIRLPPFLDNKLIRHFIRGYIDGDGSITKTKDNRIILEIIGNKDFLYDINSHLKENIYIDNKNKLIEEGKAFGLKYSSQKQIKKIYEYLYKPSNIYLERKEEKLASLVRNNQLRLSF